MSAAPEYSQLVTASGADLDEWARALGVPTARTIIEDGRAPDFLTGVPLESDAEMRAKLLAYVARAQREGI